MSENDIVISGMSGRFPMSRNVDEFSKNLFDGIDMVTNSEDRWPEETFGLVNRLGRIPDMDVFDATYFGLMSQFAEILDPQSKILLETTIEAIIDAGINPQSLKGSRTGVYIGISKYAMTEGYPDHFQPDILNPITLTLSTFGNMQSLLANRISYTLDFKGPSLLTDTACSASLSALTLAFNDFKLGNIDYAIVGGSHLTLQPYILQMQQEVGICSPRGISAILDESADGFVKGDAIACLFLQKRSTAKRVYANVLSAKINNDGRKTVGMFFPSTEAQESLMVTAYKEAGVDPLKLTFMEAHCTGTKVGDTQEVKAIYNAYCALPGRTDQLPLGLLKSNIGHTEGCSGIASIIKVLISYENERIPPNINLKQIKQECLEYFPPLYPNLVALDYEPGMAGVNNFGIGGVNANALIEPNYKLANEDNLEIAETIPRIVNICGRTEQAVRYLFDYIENNPDKVSRDFLALLTDVMKNTSNVKSTGFPYRASMIIKKSTEDQSENKYQYLKKLSEFKSMTLRPVWFLFPGLGGQWPAMAKALMPIKVFADKVEECHQILSEFGINLKHLLLSEDEKTISTMTAKFCITTSIELALFEILKSLDVIPDGVIGHSFGETACAYADGCLTAKQAMVVTYFRGLVTENDKQISNGLMAVCGLTRAEAKKLIPPEVVIACYNAKDVVVLSGPFKQMEQLINQLKDKQIFCHQLESSGIPYHSKYLQTSAQPMIDMIKKYIPTPIKRSDKWVSTSILNSESCDEVLKYGSAEYFVNNLLSPVYFYDKFRELPSNAIVVEVGPHGVFRKIVEQTLEESTYLSLIKKNSNDTNLDYFLLAIATLYELGLNPSIENLYPPVEWPVSRGTPSIGSLMKWDHSLVYERRKFPDDFNKSTSADTIFEVSLSNIGDSYYAGHSVDGNLIFPATGYLMLAWRQFAATLGKTWNEVPVVFEQCQFRRPIFLSDDSQSKLKVKLDQNTGEFQISENDNLCSIGKIRSPTDDTLLAQHLLQEKPDNILENEFCLDREDIYKELRCMGYDYSGEFRRMKEIRTKDFKELTGICEWNGKLVSFLDGLFHSMAFCYPFRKLMVPIMIKSLRIDPKVLLSAIAQHKVMSIETGEDKKNEEIMRSMAVEQESSELMEAIDYNTARREAKFCLFISDMPFHFNCKTRLIVTHGIEIEDVMTFPVPRRIETNNLVLDSYEYIANDDNKAIEEYDHKNVIDYIEVCKSMAAKLKQKGLKELNCDFNYKQISTEQLENYKQMNMDSHVLFKILDKITGLVEDNNDKQTKVTQNQIDSIFDEFNLEQDMVNTVSKNERLIRTMTDIVCENNVPKREVTVTEINLSSDLLVKEVEQNMANFQIIPTFVDYRLIVKSKDNINETFVNNSIVWNKNEELSLRASDLIIFRDCFDFWSIDLKTLVQKLKDNVNNNGFLLVVVKHRLTEPEQALSSIQNGNRFLKNSELEHRYNEILKVAKEFGLLIICKKFDLIGNSCLLFRKIDKTIKIPEINQMIEITGERSEHWFQMIKENLCLIRETDDKMDNIWLIATDNNINGILGLMNCLRVEPGGENLRCIFDADCKTKLPIDWNSEKFSNILKYDLVFNVIKNGKLGTYRHLKLAKGSDRVPSNEYFLNLGQTRDLSSLQWYDSRNIKPYKDRVDVNGNRVEDVSVCIYSSGLTFHDVMVATGRIPAGPQLLFTDCLIGIEFAGRRADTRQRVMGFELSRCFATSINASVDMISPIPEHWSMDDAITILSTYSTVWYGLIERAGLKQGESILIHSGAGGVGQAAINVCKHYNCDIYATVGNEEKKRFLINENNIPENRIFSSRDIQFKLKIKELTDGRGVDLVLNSLIGEKLEASYDCLAEGGRFVELGKYDQIQNKKLGMFDFLRDISFIGIAVDVCLINKPDFSIRFFDWIHKNCNNGCVKPLNRTVFNVNEPEKAFKYMTTGKHIGKIVIKIRDEEENRCPIEQIKPAKELLCICKTYFDPNKVYIITGGLGGFGLELVHWMTYLGAKKFVLTSRSGIKTDYQKYVINQMVNYGKYNKFLKIDILVAKNDCMTAESTRQLISDASKLGQIAGIFHLTLVLNDCLIQDQTFDGFCETIDAKYKVCSNLDVESRKLDYKLDYFAVISSVASGKGNSGQSNYGFGNSICERICEQRRDDGLHGLAIQFGPFGDVGVIDEKDQTIGLSIFQKQRINSCCNVLDKLLTLNKSVVTSFVKSVRTSDGSNPKRKMIKRLWNALGIDPETTPEHLTLGEIGMESMFAVELQQEMEREYNYRFPLNHIKLITIKMLKDYESGKSENTQLCLDEMKKASETMSNFKFIIPNETYSQLNGSKTGKPIYFMPPFEITFSAFEELANKFDRPVIGLNWTKDMSNLKTIKEITKYYMDLLKVLEPNGKYDLVGYFEGALVIPKLLLNGLINEAVIVDIIDAKGLKDGLISDDYIIKMIFKYMTKGFPISFTDKIFREINAEPDLNSKIRLLVSEIKKFVGRGLIATDLEQIFHIAVKRVTIISEYIIRKRNKHSNQLQVVISKKWAKKTGKIKFIKQFQLDKVDDFEEMIDDTRDLYFLPQENESKDVLTIEVVDSGNSLVLTSDLVGEQILAQFN